MKASLLIFAFVVASASLKADEKDAMLEEGVKFIHAMWTDVIGKPELQIDPVPEDGLKALIGTWRGPYIGRSAKPELIFELNEDGTWASRVVGPDLDADEIADSVQTGRWYLHSGMVLLYDHPVSKDEGVNSALFKKDGKLRLLAVQMDGGFVELAQHDRAEHDGADQPATASESKPEEDGTQKAKPEERSQ
ncbi:MAG TPA: hypothetical protein VMN36_06665 [Verrucomicrobiales bacterium]|nr:hypothetical protein [Verrucomicrobiales bacterium]